MYFLGVLGIKIKIMLLWDQSGKLGPKKPLPYNVSVKEPKAEIVLIAPTSDIKSKPEVTVPVVSVVPVDG
jgi:small subunit ribosomal protein S3e